MSLQNMTSLPHNLDIDDVFAKMVGTCFECKRKGRHVIAFEWRGHPLSVCKSCLLELFTETDSESGADDCHC